MPIILVLQVMLNNVTDKFDFCNIYLQTRTDSPERLYRFAGASVQIPITLSAKYTHPKQGKQQPQP